jgi:two-component sensor histidine kinase
MSAMSDLIAQHADLSEGDVEWLHLLIGDWQVVSDLAFADLVLCLPTRDGTFVVIAQARPSTGATVHFDDIVGRFVPDAQQPHLAAALREKRTQRLREPRWLGPYAVREEAVPVMHEGRAIAVVARQTNLGSGRTPSRLELNYVEAADDIIAMIARGEFPNSGAATWPGRGAPRVGDGLIRLNADGDVLYASPNALSCFHRLGLMGPLVGQSLVEVTTDVLEHHSTVDEALPLVVMGRAAWRTDVESRGVVLSLRAIPLTDHGRRLGAVLVCRDVSEVRRRERELISKDATIREIHHRVKNNLATVAALLRLQSRRVKVPEAREALDEAMRRVATISLVHEFLSQTLDEHIELDEMLQRTLRMTAEVASTGIPVRTVQTGSFGPVPAADSTPLALVLAELVTNAVQHGFPPGMALPDGRDQGTVWVDVQRTGSRLTVQVRDDGVGMSAPDMNPEDVLAGGLGTQIVHTLVANELRGSITWRAREGGGTEVVLVARLGEG